MIEHRKWLKVRAEVYNKYMVLPRHCEPLGLRIDAADSGWIDMIFSISGKSYKITLSSFPEPFVGIRQWLEDIIVRTDQLDFTLDVDCDTSWDTIFHYEHLYDLDNDGGCSTYMTQMKKTIWLDMSTSMNSSDSYTQGFSTTHLKEKRQKSSKKTGLNTSQKTNTLPASSAMYSVQKSLKPISSWITATKHAGILLMNNTAPWI